MNANPDNIARARAGFTLVEVLVATVVTALVAGAVAGTISAVHVGLDDQDSASAEIARLARAQARRGDHLYRARMILSQRDDAICLWVPSEVFDGSSTNATDYDTINANELRWYVVDRTARTLSVQRLANQSSRTSYQLSTDWNSLRTGFAVAQQLTTSVVLEGVLEGAFRYSSFNPCADRRAVLDIQLDDDHGGIHYEMGGLVDNLQKHLSCQ